MLKTVFAGVLLGLIAASAPAAAQASCSTHCDYVHDYGPYDFTYVRPGLYAFPRCGPTGDCGPYVVYSWQRPRIVIRPRARRQ
jgi:hypothetical protein